MTVPVAPLRDGFRPTAGCAWLVGALVAVLGIAGSLLVAREQAASADEIEKARFAKAVNAMTDALGRTPPGALRLPLYANVTASAVSDPAEIRRLLVEQVTGRVRWRESVLAMAAAGIEQFVELGGKVLGPMIGRIVPDAKVTSVIAMADIEALAKEL